MKIFWIGGVAEKEDFNKMLECGNTQIAANKTQLNYIEGLEEVLGDSIKILNSHFEPSFPKYKKLFIKRREWNRKGKENIDIGFWNIPILKYVLKSIILRKEMKKIIKEELDKEDLNIFFIYAMTAPLMLLASFIKKNIKDERVKICLVVPDLPEYMNMTKQSIIKKVLSMLNRKIIYKCLKHIDKYVLFAEPMAERLKIKPKDYIVIEGMVNKEIIESKEIINKKNYIMYAGGMNEKYGVLNLVKAFHNIKDSDTELWLYGTGDAVDKIEEIAKDDIRIKYKGMVSNEQIIVAEKEAMILVNPRPTCEEYTKYSFPSKNMEYMLSGTPLVTTKLPAMPKEYYEYIYCFGDESIEGMQNKLQQILKMDIKYLNQKGKEAKAFILIQKNNIVQCKKIVKLILGDKNE